MHEPVDFSKIKIHKKIIHAGTTYKKVTNGSKVLFHYIAKKLDENHTILDDSRKFPQPVQLVIGKKFKLEVWETIVKEMAINEVSSFQIHRSLLYGYPIVAKTLRDNAKSVKTSRTHCCAHALQTEGVGYQDLNSLLKTPSDLEFIIELINVENEGEYEKDNWQLSEEERLIKVPQLKEEGNLLYKDGKYTEASQKYCQAIGFLEQLMLCEKPHDTEWKKLNELKLLILLNLAQCRLVMKEYYLVIEHCGEVLQFQPDNVKALYRRAKAHMNVGNIEESKLDFQKASTLDSNLIQDINKLFKELDMKTKESDDKMKNQLHGKLF